jgi:hypothetical protein
VLCEWQKVNTLWSLKLEISPAFPCLPKLPAIWSTQVIIGSESMNLYALSWCYIIFDISTRALLIHHAKRFVNDSIMKNKVQFHLEFFLLKLIFFCTERRNFERLLQKFVLQNRQKEFFLRLQLLLRNLVLVDRLEPWQLQPYLV